MKQKLVGLTSALALAGVALAAPTSVWADNHTDICNPVLDGNGEAVVEDDGDVVVHTGSAPCSKGEVEKIAETETEVETVVVVAPIDPLVVFFDVNEESLSPKAEADLRAYAGELIESDPEQISVVGYTDTSGPVALNERLSRARAQAVSSSLIQAGVPVGLISRESEGEDDLAVETPDGEREADNRRVVVNPVY